jgi:biotin operon repressor
MGRPSRLVLTESVRLFSLVCLLSPKVPTPGPLLAADLGVDLRTIQRYVMLLRRAGWDLEASHEGYCLGATLTSLPLYRALVRAEPRGCSTCRYAKKARSFLGIRFSRRAKPSRQP